MVKLVFVQNKVDLLIQYLWTMLTVEIRKLGEGALKFYPAALEGLRGVLRWSLWLKS